MSELTVEQAKAVYRSAIDAGARDSEGSVWWDEVCSELAHVLSARSLAQAAAVISWWHHDWSTVSDTLRDAAQRIRRAARAIHLSRCRAR